MRIDQRYRPAGTNEQPRTRWVDQAAFGRRRADLRLGTSSHRVDRAGEAAVDRIAVRHTVRTSTAEY